MVHRKGPLAFAAALFAGALALSSCSSPASTSSPSAGGSLNGAGKTISVFINALPQYAQQQQQWFSDVAAKFKQQTGATVSFETFASANDEMTKIQTSVVSGTGPDVYLLGTTFTPTAYSTGAFVEMTDATWQAVGGKSKFIPATLGISGPDDAHQVGIPFVTRPFVLAYNTDLLSAAGISAPATSWDELTTQAKKLSGNGVYGLAVAYKDNYDPWKYIWAMDNQMGNQIIQNGKVSFNDASTLKAYQTYFGWVATDHVVDPASVGWSNAQALAAFASGKAAYMLMTTATAIPTLDNSPLKGKYKFALMPTIPPGASSLPSNGRAAASILSGDNIVVAKYSKNQDLAFALVKMLTDDEMQQAQYKLFGNLPANQATANSLTSGNSALAPIVDAAAKSYATPFNGAWGTVQLSMVNVVVQMIPDLANGSVDTAKLQGLLNDAQKADQTAVDQAK